MELNILNWGLIGFIVGTGVYLINEDAKSSYLLTLITGILGGIIGGIFVNLLLGRGLSGFSFLPLGIAGIGALITSYLQRNIFSQKPEEQVAVPGDPWFEEFVKDLNYPISKRDMIRFAEEKDASEEVLSVLESLPDHIYESEAQLTFFLHSPDSSLTDKQYS